VKAKDLIVAPYWIRDLHRDLAAAESLLDGPMLDLQRLCRLRHFRPSASDPDLVATPEVPVGKPNDGYSDPVEVVSYDADLLFHGGHPPNGEERTHERPRRSL